MKEERSTGRAILAAAVCLIIWELIGLILSLLTTVSMLEYLSAAESMQEGAVIILLIFGAVTIAAVYGEYKLCLYLMPKIAKTTPTTALSFKIFGWLLIVIGIINIIPSISDGSTVNFLGIFLGYCFIRKAKELV